VFHGRELLTVHELLNRRHGLGTPPGVDRTHVVAALRLSGYIPCRKKVQVSKGLVLRLWAHPTLHRELFALRPRHLARRYKAQADKQAVAREHDEGVPMERGLSNQTEW
jgi:hypothetical protein